MGDCKGEVNEKEGGARGAGLAAKGAEKGATEAGGMNGNLGNSVGAIVLDPEEERKDGNEEEAVGEEELPPL